MLPRAIPFAVLTSLVLMLSCHESIPLPPVKGPPLTIPEEGAARAEQRELEVVYVSPKGQLSSPHTQITVTFNKPMVALEQVEGRAAKAPLAITPAIPGKQRWLGSRALVFQPDRELPGATTFEVQMPAGVKALDGSALAQPMSWSFSTPRLKVERTLPYAGTRWASPQQTVRVFFNQPVTAATVAKHVAFFARQNKSGATATIGARVEPIRTGRDGREDPKAVLVLPEVPLPLDAFVTLRIGAGLVGREGPLPMAKDYGMTFSTYGPLEIKRIGCTKSCDPDDTVRIEFSNPVARNLAQRAIRIDGKPIKRDRSSYHTSYYYVSADLKPQRRYAVTVARGLVDKFGQSLAQTWRTTFNTRDYEPYARLPVGSGVVELAGPKRLPLVFRNAQRAVLRHKRLNDADAVALLSAPGFDDREKVLLAAQPGVQETTFKVAGARNQRVVHTVDLGGLVGGRGSGLLALELDATLDDKERVVRRAVLRITDLAMTAKLSPHSNLVWVTSLASGRPVAGAEVVIFRPGDQQPRWKGRTDRSGLCEAPGTLALGLKPADRELIYFARSGDDESFVEASSTEGLSPWMFGYDEAWDAGADATLGMIFSDRGIYRPGDTVQLKGILRQRGPQGLVPVQGEIALTVSDSRGEVLRKQKLELTEFGSFAVPLATPHTAPLGSYSVTAKAHAGGTVYGRFRVEEYRAAEFAVTVKTDRAQYVRGDALQWSGAGRYLFGAAMRGAKHGYDISYSPSSFAPPGHAGFVFADEVPWWAERHVRTSGTAAEGSGKLDADGVAKGSLQLKPPQMAGPARYTVELSVTDVSRQTIASRSTALLHPAEIYVGARPEETFLSAGEKLAADIIAADPRGKRQGGVKVSGTLFLRTWESVRKQGLRGAHYFVTQPVETASGSCEVTTTGGGKPARCVVPLTKAGYYVLRLQAKDRRGNPVRASLGAYATGAGYVPWRRAEDAKLELVPNRKSYKVGQTARVLIKSPFTNAYGLLTVESNGIHLRRPLRLTQTATWVEVPIDRALVPNAFVSVMLVRGRIAMPAPKQKGQRESWDEQADPGKPTFKAGYVKLVVDQRSRELDVRVTPRRTELRPGETVTVDLAVRDARGKPQVAELTVIAADEGVLSLIDYKTPDPMSVFYADRGLSVRTADNRNALINPSVFGQKGGNPGGGGGGEGESAQSAARSRFASTPFYAPAVITDDKGHARVSFKLPDNLTTFRIMAVAASREAEFGSGDASVTVAKPLLLLPTLPRVLRVGDTVEAGVVVHNHTKRAGSIGVRAEVSGVDLVGPATQQLPIDDGGAVEARFRFKARSPGEATFRFFARLGDEHDGLEQRRPVKLPVVIETVAVSGSTTAAVAEGIVPQGAIRKDVGGLEIAMASSALVGLKGGFEYLLDYPYECVEQSTSRLVPLVLLSDLAAAYGLVGAKPGARKGDRQQAKALIGKLIAKVEKLQRWDGGFAYWPSSHDSAPWASAYAAWGLLQAQRSGHRVSQRVLDNAKRYLKRQLGRSAPTGEDAGVLRDQSAYLAFVLGELGEKTGAYLANLYDQREDLATFSKALLLSAMVRAGGDRKAIDTLTQDMVNEVHQTAHTAKVEANYGDGYAALFASSNRSTALVLDALLQARPDHPLVDKLVRYLVAEGKDGRWRNTQETVYALLGLHRYYKVREQQPPDFLARIVLEGKQIAARSFVGRSLKVQQADVPMSALLGHSGALGFVKEGRGTLHYTARLRYARQKLPEQAWDEGLFVTRTYERIAPGASSFAQLRGNAQGGGDGTARVNAGDLVRVVLRIVVPQQLHFVAVEDPLPAGLEAVDFQLMTATQSLRRAVSHSYRSRYGASSYSSQHYTPFYHREIRDDRVQLFADALPPGEYSYVYVARATTAGRFVVPPARAEQMYAPEVFGRTGATTFTVAGQ